MAQGCHSWTLNSNRNEILLSIDATVELSEASLVDSCSLLGNPVVTGWKTHIKCTFSNFFCRKFRSFFFDCCCQCSMWRVFFVVWVLMWFAYKTGFYNEGKNLQSLYRNLISIYIVHLSFLAFLHFTHYKYPLLRHAPKEIISKFQSHSRLKHFCSVLFCFSCLCAIFCAFVNHSVFTQFFRYLRSLPWMK